jgi:hypothetical protein
MGWKTELGMDLLGFSWAEKVGGMFAKSARRGFHIPFTPKSVAGVNLRGWGALSSESELGALGIFEKKGIFRVSSAMAAASSKFEQKIASNVAARYILGRAAGITLAGANLWFTGSLAIQGAYFGYQALAGTIGRPNYLELGGHFIKAKSSQGNYSF